MNKVCKRCSKTYETEQHASKYCDDCKALGSDVLKGKVFDYTKLQICDYCNKEFYYNRKRKYCSDDCMKEAQLLRAKEDRKNKTHQYKLKCKDCSTKILTIYKTIKYCKECLNKRLAKAAEENLKKIKYVFYKTKCTWCGTTYTAKKAEGANYLQRFCSKRCRDAYNGKIKRARKRSASIEIVNAINIFNRDNWICHICNKKIYKKYKWPNPLSPSLDHIIPLSKGGSHSQSNIKAAHLGCNCSKGNRTLENGEQLMLFG